MTRRCSQCGINYPTTVFACRVCESKTDLFSNDQPDEDWEVRCLDVQVDLPVFADSQVLRWRLNLLERAGYPPAEAWALARDRDVDLHGALDLLGSCRDAALAFSILA